MWNAVEEAEKSKDSRLAREFVVALPVELSKEQNISLISEYVKDNFAADEMCADFCIHDTDGHNPHAHIMLTVRPLDQNGKWQSKTEKEYLCVKNGEERGFTSAEFKSAQADGLKKQYQYFVGKKKVYMPPSQAEGLERVSKYPKSTRYGSKNGSYIGLTKNISLYYEDVNYAITVMIPKSDYSQMKLRDTMQILLVSFLLLFSVIICSLYFSKKYISPILKGLERIKKSQTNIASNIAEIDNLFEFLSQKDSEYEKSLAELSKQNERAKSEISRVQTENERLASIRKKFVLQDDYDFFLTGLKQLTPTEKAIFNLYMDGKSAIKIWSYFL